MHERKREGCEGVRDKLRGAYEIGQRPGHLVHTVSAGDVLVLIANHITRVTLGIVIAQPMQVGEE